MPPAAMAQVTHAHNSMRECTLPAPGGRSAVDAIGLAGRMQLHLTLFSNTRTTDKHKRTYYKKGRLWVTYIDQTTNDSGGRSRVMSFSTEANWEGILNEIGQDLGRVLRRRETRESFLH